MLGCPDVHLSKDLALSFTDHLTQNHDSMAITFSIMVLSADFWPLNPPQHGFTVPAEIFSIYNQFQAYYQTKHLGRKLVWLWNYSKNELRTNYLNQKYIFITSSYQMAVLLQYNQHDRMSLYEFVTATGIPKDILRQVLMVLVEAKVLVADEEMGRYDSNYDLNPSMFFFVGNFFCHSFPHRLQIQEDPCQPRLTDQSRRQGRVCQCHESG